MSKLFLNLNKLLNIETRHTSGYHPRCNSVTKRYNGTLADCLLMYVNKEQTNWSNYVQPVTFAYNSSFQNTIKTTPFEVVFGRHPMLPTNVTLRLNTNNGYLDSKQRADHLVVTLEKSKRDVSERIRKAQEKQKLRYDAKHREISFKPGDQVLVINPVYKSFHRNKLSRRYIGPFKVLQKISDLLYLIEWNHDQFTGVGSKVVNVQTLKPYISRKMPSKHRSDPEMSDSDFEELSSNPDTQYDFSQSKVLQDLENDYEIITENELETEKPRISAPQQPRRSQRNRRQPERLGVTENKVTEVTGPKRSTRIRH